LRQSINFALRARRRRARSAVRST